MDGLMLHIQCPACRTQAFADCTCPPGWDPAVRGHVSQAVADKASQAGFPAAACPFSSLDAQVTCPPGSGCCQVRHDHGAAASACPGGHGDCPEPDTCAVWAGASANLRHPLVGQDPGPCPGGHCHKDIPGCTVCRPLVITVIPGSTQVQPVAAFGG
jgi:hypothetical protein